MDIPVTITTPFAEVVATLGFPADLWELCRFSPRVLRKMVRTSDVQGFYMPRQETMSQSSWRLKMHDLIPFPCVQPPSYTDVWERLRATPARIELWSPEDALVGGTARPLVNEDDELALGAVDRKLVGSMHMSVLLLRDAELAVDDVTVIFREPGGIGAEAGPGPNVGEDECAELSVACGVGSRREARFGCA